MSAVLRCTSILLCLAVVMAQQDVEQVGNIMAVTGRVLIKWKDLPTADVLSSYGLQEQTVLTDILKVYVITDGSSVQDKIGMLQTLASVDYAEPDGIVSIDQPVGMAAPARFGMPQ